MMDPMAFRGIDNIGHRNGPVNRLKWQRRHGRNFNDSSELWFGGVF
jgi:hypothetical protein